eukprot:scaffold135192_cov24-Tisochrysis_lutea.AAC.1
MEHHTQRALKFRAQGQISGCARLGKLLHNYELLCARSWPCGRGCRPCVKRNKKEYYVGSEHPMLFVRQRYGGRAQCDTSGTFQQVPWRDALITHPLKTNIFAYKHQPRTTPTYIFTQSRNHAIVVQGRGYTSARGQCPSILVGLVQNAQATNMRNPPPKCWYTSQLSRCDVEHNA